MGSMTSEHYHPIIDNYCLSIPAMSHEVWRNSLQVLYDTMKICVSEPIGIDGFWFDMHELSEEHDERFSLSRASVLLGTRKIAYASFLPAFLKYHEMFFAAIRGFSPETGVSREECASLARGIVGKYKQLIDTTRNALEQVRESDWRALLFTLPDVWGLREHVASRLEMHASEFGCFSYPRCSAGCGGVTKDYATALGDSLLFRGATDDAIQAKEPLIFIPADDPFYEDTYPGTLSSYQARLRFTREVFESIDLVKEREEKMLRMLLENKR